MGVIFIRALEEKILNEGEVFPGEILKVGSFLNQKVDVAFLNEMGREIARLFEGAGVTKILTVEASGIAIAFAAASAMNVPMVFAKKHQSLNLPPELIKASVYSFTHKKTYDIVISEGYITEEDTILVVDDFLANGNALVGLFNMAEQVGAKIAGAAIAIEKGFQGGGDKLRSQGIRIESLAIIDKMTDDSIEFRPQ